MSIYRGVRDGKGYREIGSVPDVAIIDGRNRVIFPKSLPLFGVGTFFVSITLNGSSGRWTTGLTKSEGLYESQVLMKNEQVYAIALVELS
jgi:hypothetical protein